MEKKCLYFKFKNDKCFKYVVKDRRSKKHVYGIAFCDEPGVPSDYAPPCMEQEGYPITKYRKIYKEVNSPEDCAYICEYDFKKKCILWEFNKKEYTCRLTLLKAKWGSEYYSSFDRSYCSYFDTTPYPTSPYTLT